MYSRSLIQIIIKMNKMENSKSSGIKKIKNISQNDNSNKLKKTNQSLSSSQPLYYTTQK